LFIVDMNHSNFYMCGLQNTSQRSVRSIAKNLDTHHAKVFDGASLRQVNNYKDTPKLECTAIFQDFYVIFFSKCEELCVGRQDLKINRCKITKLKYYLADFIHLTLLMQLPYGNYLHCHVAVAGDRNSINVET
jgi:hypothetical protein